MLCGVLPIYKPKGMHTGSVARRLRPFLKKKLRWGM